MTLHIANSKRSCDQSYHNASMEKNTSALPLHNAKSWGEFSFFKILLKDLHGGVWELLNLTLNSYTTLTYNFKHQTFFRHVTSDKNTGSFKDDLHPSTIKSSAATDIPNKPKNVCLTSSTNMAIANSLYDSPILIKIVCRQARHHYCCIKATPIDTALVT